MSNGHYYYLEGKDDGGEVTSRFGPFATSQELLEQVREVAQKQQDGEIDPSLGFEPSYSMVPLPTGVKRDGEWVQEPEDRGLER